MNQTKHLMKIFGTSILLDSNTFNVNFKNMLKKATEVLLSKNTHWDGSQAIHVLVSPFYIQKYGALEGFAPVAMI